MAATNKPKRDKQVSVRVSDDDLALLRAAAHKLWSDLDVSLASVMLNLAKARAKQVLADSSSPSTKRR
jgi:uncharacterized protein (DUF1778 family)